MPDLFESIPRAIFKSNVELVLDNTEGKDKLVKNFLEPLQKSRKLTGVIKNALIYAYLNYEEFKNFKGELELSSMSDRELASKAINQLDLLVNKLQDLKELAGKAINSTKESDVYNALYNVMSVDLDKFNTKQWHEMQLTEGYLEEHKVEVQQDRHELKDNEAINTLKTQIEELNRKIEEAALTKPELDLNKIIEVVLRKVTSLQYDHIETAVRAVMKRSGEQTLLSGQPQKNKDEFTYQTPQNNIKEKEMNQKEMDIVINTTDDFGSDELEAQIQSFGIGG